MKRSYVLVVTVIVLALLSSASQVIAQGPDPFQPSLPEAGAGSQTALGTTFTYQGQLKKIGVPVSAGSCMFTLLLFDAETGGAQIGSTLFKSATTDSNGFFTIALDFGANAFKGDARWLEILVGCDGDASTKLSPRQQLTPSPMALALPGLFTQQNATSPNLIGGYSGNQVTSGVNGATIGGGGTSGLVNRVTDDYGVVGGGAYNQAGDNSGTTVDSSDATVSGGAFNTARNSNATVGGGGLNTAGGTGSTIAGGLNNVASGSGTFVGGGGNDGTHTLGNIASGNLAVVVGGSGNVASGYGSVVGGGGGYVGSTVVSNTASASWATVGGGGANSASGSYAIVGGGWGNTASSSAATVPGGMYNVAGGSYSFAAGFRAKANHTGSFVWGDSTNADFASTAPNQFLIRASGNVGIGTNSPNASVHISGADSILRIQSTANNVWPRTMYQTDVRQWDTGVGGSAVTNDLKGKYYVFDATAGQTRMAIDTSGNVGIGVTSPDQKLVVNAGALTRLAIDSTANGNAGIQLRQGGVSRWAVATVGTDGDFSVYEDDTGVNRLYIKGAGAYQGNVGIGTTNPTVKLDVAGTMASNVVQIRGGSDLAEKFDVSTTGVIEPGTLMVIDENNPGKLKPSDQPYDTKVAGIASGAGGVQPGLTLQQQGVMEGNTVVAIAGRVYVKADATTSPIKPGDLLTTSSTPGRAMKATDRDRAQGAIIGKAMSELEKGAGLVLVLVNLQ